jgi:hypothetical protein
MIKSILRNIKRIERNNRYTKNEEEIRSKKMKRKNKIFLRSKKR